MFKVGDKVRVKAPGMWQGRIGTIVVDRGIGVWDVRFRPGGQLWGFCKDELELVEPAPSAKSYTFSVPSADKIDYARICNEADAGTDAVLVVDGKNAVLLLRMTWLDRFPMDYGINIAGAPIFNIRAYTVTHSGQELPDAWRCRSLTTAGIPAALADLKAARKWLAEHKEAKAIEVKVTAV